MKGKKHHPYFHALLEHKHDSVSLFYTERHEIVRATVTEALHIRESIYITGSVIVTVQQCFFFGFKVCPAVNDVICEVEVIGATDLIVFLEIFV